MNVKEIIAEVESKTQGSRPWPRPRTPNNPRPRPSSEPLGAKNRNARGQNQGLRTQSASVFQKKVFINLPRGVWRVLQDEEKKVMTLAHFLQ